MLNRRLFAKIAAFLPGFAASAAPEASTQKTVAIAMRFKFEGKNYGLAVPVFDPRSHGKFEEIGGDITVTLSDDELRLLIHMLQDLRWSRAETLRMLREGKALEEVGVNVWQNPLRS